MTKMPSLIQGFEYDVFISYRQKDNKGDRWVSEFVDALKTELESTFKEEISVYFDINPHDGLLETHDVDASLKEKLKCLIFIPIISRTYCDPKSFAWENEFNAFVEQVSQDQFGLKVKLPNGNIASRVLPIRIHDLDNEDIKLCESVLDGALRGVDFIYKEPGVDRPLKPTDDEKSNLNKTKYINQINKVANAIREIITAIGQHSPHEEERDVSKAFKSISIPRKSSKTKIIVASGIIIALILPGYFIIQKLSNSSKRIEKSIAVLPFKSLSDDPEKQYLADGTMDAILLHLQKFSDLRVLSRTSVEQYRGTKKTTYAIGQELGVSYLLEGSFQKSGDNVRLIVQLINASNKESHAWANEYDRTWKDIFSVQSEVAQTIAKELHTIITPEEKQLIEKIPTNNLTAYDFYQQAREEHTKYWNDENNKAALQKAEDFYYKSLKHDSTFAQAYLGLARVYWDKHYWKGKEYLSKNFGDSVLILTKIALSFDDQLSEAYTLRGKYYSEVGKPEQTIEEFNKAIKLNPNDWMAYNEKGEFYYYTDFVNTINYLQKAASINRGPELPGLLGDIGAAYLWAGFPDKAKQYSQDKLKLDGDSSSYYSSLAAIEFWNANINKSIEYAEKVKAIDTTDVFWLGTDYAWIGQYKESIKYYKKYFERLKVQGEIDVNGMHRIGYAYWQNGYKEKAVYFFNEQIKYCNKMIELKRSWGQGLYAYFDLAGVYAFRGEKDQAYKNLRIFNQIQRVNLVVPMLMKTDPLFKSIRNEPEFQQIARDVEAKYQAEHERVRKWIEEKGDTIDRTIIHF
jgi:TolB-like protein/Tfp pilus assembly protein PilF